MSNYASTAQIQALLQRWQVVEHLDAYSQPTLATVEDWIDQVEAEIDGVLRAQGYETIPATGTQDVKLLSRYVAEMVAYFAWKEAYGHADIPDGIKDWRDGYTSFLSRLRRGEQRLAGQAAQEIGVVSIRLLPEEDDQ